MYRKEKPVNEEEAVEFDEKKLKLVCVDFVSKVEYSKVYKQEQNSQFKTPFLSQLLARKNVFLRLFTNYGRFS